MTNNPREQAIEKIVNIIRDKSLNGTIFAKIAAEAILDALNIEVVSKESEPNYSDIVNCELITDSVGSWKNKTFYGWFGHIPENTKYRNLIILKPAVYVENIGVKL